ncbi:unnamed protein product [Ectocarpus sp. 12 AP-2014]
MSSTTTRLSSTVRRQTRSTTAPPPEMSDRKRREIQEQVDKIHNKTEVLVADLLDKVRREAEAVSLTRFLLP